MSTTFIHTDIECPDGHVFDMRRQYASAGYTVSTRCPTCRKQFDVSVPNAKAPTKNPARALHERDIEAQLVKRVKELGGEVRKVQWGGRVGAPDRVVMLPERERYVRDDIREIEGGPLITKETRRPATIWVEVKAPGKAAKFPANAHERAQHREHERMRRVGQRVVVVDSFEQIEELLK